MLPEFKVIDNTKESSSIGSFEAFSRYSFQNVNILNAFSESS